MPLDPSIYGMMQQPRQMPGPLDQFTQALQVGHLMDQSQLSGLQRQQLQQGIDDEQRIRDLFSRGTPSAEQIMAVSPSKGIAYQKSLLENKKLTGDIGKTDVETQAAQAKLARDTLAGVQNQQSYDAWRADGASRGWHVAKTAPDVFDPKWQQNAIMDADKWLSQKNADRTAAETGRHNLVTEGATTRSAAELARHNTVTEGQAAATLTETQRHHKQTESGLSEAQKKELSSLEAQANTVQGAIDAVKTSPSAFGLKRGAATLAGAIPESLAGRLDSPQERQARAFVFNVVSKVINERAGAAQSAQELARLRSFLPAETDASDQITDKLKAFQSYLSEQRTAWAKPQTAGSATTPPPAATPPAPTREQIDAELRRRGVTR